MKQLERCLTHGKILNKCLMLSLLASALLSYRLYWKPESDVIGVRSSFILPHLPGYSVCATCEVGIELVFIKKILMRKIRHKACLLGAMTDYPTLCLKNGK